MKDVCTGCNSGVLSNLDGYGKELYERYFATVRHADESIDFEYDERLIRWLLKLSFNSARAQNADVRVLREYRKVILGELPLTDRVQCWLHLVPPTFVGASEQPRPARFDERNESDIEEPLWFRIGQFRLPSHSALTLVQRVVYINSFAFTLLIAPSDSELPFEEFDQWARVFSDAYPHAKAILRDGGRVAALTGGDHAAETFNWLLCQYPTRFTDSPNPQLAAAIKGEMGVFLLHIPAEVIEEGDIAPIATILHDMVGTREQVMAYKQRISVMVSGFDNDPRALWQIPQVRGFLRRLFLDCQFVMLLSHPEGSLLKLLTACWLYGDELSEETEKQRMKEFLERAFQGLNELTHKLALSEELNREICMAARFTLPIGSPATPYHDD